MCSITDTTSDEDLSKCYTPFGLESTVQKDAAIHTESESFIGERFDPEAELMYLNARYYDPTLGLFLQPDWFEVTKQGVGTNRYSYSFNDPVNLKDPNGNFVPLLLGALAAADWALTSYDQYQAHSDWKAGTLSDTQYAARTAMNVGAAFVPFDAIARWGGKGIYAARKFGAGVANNFGSRIVDSFGPLREGPISKKLANTFRSGTYDEVITTEPTILYRVIGDKGNPGGEFWTRRKPEGPLQSVIDSALDQNWGNTATTVVEMEVPTGTRMFEGVAERQSGLVGGGNQIVFDRNVNPVKLEWLK